MGEKKILGRLACLLVLDCVTLFRRDAGFSLTFSYIRNVILEGNQSLFYTLFFYLNLFILL